MAVSDTGVTNRAYSLLEVKAVDADARTISGVATTPAPDRVDDVLDPFGAVFAKSIPLLLHHDNKLPVGEVVLGKPTKAGIPFTATFPDPNEARSVTVRERILEAIDSARLKLIRGASIGFHALKDGVKLLDTGGIHFTAYEILEMSMVTIPMNAEATIMAVKQFSSAPHLAASGNDASTHTPGVSGTHAASAKKDARPMKTISEQIKDFESSRAAKSARMHELMNSAAEKGETLDETSSQEYDGLESEVKAIDAHLTRLATLEKTNRETAKPVNGESQEKASASRGGQLPVIQVKDTVPVGIGFARAVKVFGVAKLDGRNPADVAKEMYPHDERLNKHVAHAMALPNIITQIKAAVPGANITSGSLWAGALVDPTNLAGEFIEFLRPATIIGRLNLRNIPTNTRLIEQTQGGTGYWVGVGAPKPLTAFGYAPVILSPTKVAAIAVASEEALRYSTPSLDMLIRDGLRDALVERVDKDLLDPAEAGSTNVQPASLTNGLTALTTAGTSADNARTDLSVLVRALRAANLRGPIAIVLPDSLLTGLAFMTNSLGQPEFPGLDGDGGTYKGIRFIGSEYVANASGSGNMVVAIAEREVFLSDDGGVQVDASREASLQMLDNPTNNSVTAAPTTMVSMWQTNSVAFRGEWFINWQKRRTDAVAYMDDVNWGSVGSPA